MANSVQAVHDASVVSRTFSCTSLPSQSSILRPSSEGPVAYFPERHLGANELLCVKVVMADNELTVTPSNYSRLVEKE